MTKTRYKRTAVASLFQNGISRNTKCAERDSFRREGHIYIYIVTGPGKTGLIYTKYTCLHYGTYLLFCVCYLKSVNYIEFLMDLCIYDDILDALWLTDKKLLHFKLSKSGQILHIDKTCFPRPGHTYIYIYIYIN